jgi:hypothetical protein
MGDVLSNLLVLDYSGTLSIGTTLFGKSDTLVNALKQSGLWALGVNSEAAFWNQIVNPTWAEGSLTQVGYTSRIVKQLVAFASDSDVDQAKLQASASQFVDAYFLYGTIESEWKNIFAALRSSKAMVTIATDNYAEATQHIIDHLQSLGIGSCSALEDAAVDNQVLVANSADLGFYKANPAFWQKLKAQLHLGACSAILVVDDFGFNEVNYDSYAQAEKVKKRSLEMSETLSNVFSCEPLMFKFFVKALHDPISHDDSELYMQDYKRMIDEVSKFILQHLAKES